MTPPICPRCGSKESLELVWGHPTEETFDRADRGEIMLGGCCIEIVDGVGPPGWRCTSCGLDHGEKGEETT